MEELVGSHFVGGHCCVGLFSWLTSDFSADLVS